VNASEFQRLKAAFHALLDLAADARAARLAEIEATDSAQAAGLRRLLAAFDERDLAPAAPAADRLLGERVGPFVLKRRLGAGGMGVVYLGERADGEIEQQVAVKLPGRLAFADPEPARIARERDFLARLSHPHIARLVDAGTSATLGAWFAMEYIDGEPLTRHADRARLDLRARLTLWLQVADAVAYAHRHAIVHRDLKPGNVLVDAAGHARLLDFGIAKFIDPDAVATDTAAAFTARYASPEQIAGEPATTATDVHGLGLLLHELLCGRPAFDAPGDLALRQAIATADPPSLRAALAAEDVADAEAIAAARHVSLATLRRQLGGDLEAIVGKALRKRPAERYAAVDAFAADVRAWLAGLPVAAMPPTWSYRLQRFVARHRVASASAALALVALVAGLGVALHQRAQFLLARDQAQAENALLVRLVEGADPYQLRGSELRLSDLLEDAATETLARTDLAPALRANLLGTIGGTLLNQSRFATAEPALAAARATADAVPGFDAAARARLDLRLAAARFELGERAAALAMLDAAWPVLADADPALRIEALEWRAHMRRAQEAWAPALADIDAALALCGAACGGIVDARTTLVTKRIDLLSRLGRHDEALAEAERAWQAASALPAARADVRVLVGNSRASALAQAGRAEAAEAALDALIPLAEGLYGGRGNRLAGLHSTLEQLRRAQGRHRAAAMSAARVVALYEVTLPDSVYLAYALKTLGLNLRLVGDHAPAIAALERAAAMFVRVEGADSGEARWCAVNRAAALAMQQGTPAALPQLAAAAAAYLAGPHRGFDPVVRLLVGETAADLGDAPLAERELDALAALTDVSAGVGARAQALREQLALMAGAEPAAGAEIDAGVAGVAKAAGLTEARRLRVLARHAPGEAACTRARAAWAFVDPTGSAWDREQRALAGCP
jgi:serine/threonine-protein kinase